MPSALDGNNTANDSIFELDNFLELDSAQVFTLTCWVAWLRILDINTEGPDLNTECLAILESHVIWIVILLLSLKVEIAVSGQIQCPFMAIKNTQLGHLSERESRLHTTRLRLQLWLSQDRHWLQFQGMQGSESTSFQKAGMSGSTCQCRVLDQRGAHLWGASRPE